MNLQPGDKIGDNYVIDEFLGRGRSGTVYRARNLNLGHAVALKIYRVGDRSALARFERSAQLMSQIRSPHVVSLLDYWLEDSTPVMATEYTSGQSLRALLEARGALPWPMAVAVMQGILGGLDAIHDAAILHRNLTPENVIVAPGNPPTVKLTDLSLAKSMMGGGNSRITVAGMIVGKPQYMSPEQIHQDRVDGRSDLYSAGLLFYELVTGTLPRPGNDLMALLRTIDQPLAPPSAPQGMPPLPAGLVSVLGATLQPDRTKRPLCAADVASMLANVARQQPSAVPAPPASPAPASEAPKLRLAAESQAWNKLAKRAELGSTTGLRRTKPAAATSDAAHDPKLPRIRAILVGHLPEQARVRAQAAPWLKTLVPTGQNFFVGTGFWVAVVIAADDDGARAQGRKITREIFDRFGGKLPVRAKLVSSSFRLPRSCVEGTSPPPFEVLGLLEQLARARRG